MKTTVETTLGPLGREQLGLINAHEHLFVDSSQGPVKDPDFKLENVDYAIKDVNEWKAAGGGAMVDTMPVSAGRNVGKLIQVSRATGIPVIVSTGFHKSYYYWPDHWRFRYSEDEIFELIAAEIEQGCDLNEYQGPIVKRCEVKAGAMKVAGLYNFIDENMKKLIRVIGRVHQRTGTPVYAHTERGMEWQELVQRLNDAGVPSSSILICHMDRNADLWVHRQIARTGVFLEYDTPSRFKYQPESVVVKLMRGHDRCRPPRPAHARRRHGPPQLLESLWRRPRICLPAHALHGAAAGRRIFGAGTRGDLAHKSLCLAHERPAREPCRVNADLSVRFNLESIAMSKI